MPTFKEILLHTFTGRDNSTIDIGRIIWMLGALSFLGCAFYSIYKGQTWNAVEFGTGFGAVLAAGGVAIRIKADTEPDPKDKSNS
jgi:hypothetical protein